MLIGHTYSPRALTAISVRLCAPNNALVNGGYYEQAELAPPAELVGNPRARTRLSRLSAQLA
jgi:hypothetical protein